MRIVFVPGFTQYASSWRPVMHFFEHDPDFEPEAVDVPDGLGFADTAGRLGEQHGRAVYVGYSMGGRLALQLALDHPDTVERLVLVSASPGIADPAARDERRRADADLAQRLERIGVDAFLDEWLAQPMFASLPAAKADLEGRRANTVARLTHQLTVLGQGVQPSNWDRLDEISVPTLLFAGSKDTKYLAIAEQMADPMQANLRVLSGCGHACHLEGGSFWSLLKSWLRG